MNKILVICGPTATGKTRLALLLAEKFNGELVSADSRQVYTNMDIGTGKDIPLNSYLQFPVSDLEKYKIGCYILQGIRVWGYDLVSPKKEFSVSGYLKTIKKIIDNIYSRGKLAIVVGGTGLYIRGIIDGIPTASIPQNKKLRSSFRNKDAGELFEMLAQLDPIKAGSLNASDRKNPRRLMRGLEIAYWKVKKGAGKDRQIITPFDSLFIGLSLPKEVLADRIIKRIDERIDKGIENEIRNLIKIGVGWSSQSMNTLGYKEWKGYMSGKRTKDEVIKEWAKDEKNYAKRQMTWFKKDKRIVWVDASKSNLAKNVEKLVSKWHNKG